MNLFVSFGTLKNPLPSFRETPAGAGFGALISNLITFGTYIAGIALLGYLVYGGIMWITAAGNEDKIDSAQKTISNAVIGLIIVVVAIIITQIIGSVLGFESILEPTFEGPTTGT